MAFPILDIALKLVDKVFPDPVAKSQAQLEVLKLQQTGELAQLEAETKLALGQVEVNKVEAASPSLFKSGWRPAVGWTCVAALSYQFIGRPLLAWATGVWAEAGTPVPPPLDIGDLMTLLLGMLGLGAARTYEKINKAA